MLLTEERMCRIGKVLDHRQYSAFFFFLINNWRLLRYTLKKRVLNQGKQQLVFFDSFFFLTIALEASAGKFQHVGLMQLQTYMQLQKLRCIFDCINTYLKSSNTSLNLHFPLQSIIPTEPSFLSVHTELMSETKDWFSIPGHLPRF